MNLGFLVSFFSIMMASIKLLVMPFCFVNFIFVSHLAVDVWPYCLLSGASLIFDLIFVATSYHLMK